MARLGRRFPFRPHIGKPVLSPSTVDPFTGSLALTVTFTAAQLTIRHPGTGSWWQLLDVRKHAQEEFEFYANAPPMSCPRCGEPLLNSPPTDAGSDTELYCRFDGWRYPKDWMRPQAT